MVLTMLIVPGRYPRATQDICIILGIEFSVNYVRSGSTMIRLSANELKSYCVVHALQLVGNEDQHYRSKREQVTPAGHVVPDHSSIKPIVIAQDLVRCELGKKWTL